MNEEPGIRFAQAQIAFLRTFELPIADDIDEQTAIKKFLKRGVNSFPDDKNLADFETAESFFYSEEAKSEFFRLELEGFKIHFPRFLEQPATFSELDASIILTVYPKYNIGLLLLNFCTEGFTVDEMIFLAQCVESHNFKLKAETPDFIQLDSTEVYLEDIMNVYIKAATSTLAAKNITVQATGSRCVEINGLTDNISVDPQKLYEEHSREFYGLLTCDEGWRFVPESIAREKTQKQWSTRDFLSTISLGVSILSINCSQGERHEEYTNSQQALRKAFGYPIEGYFAFEPRIAGLNHGILLMIETASIHSFLLDQVLKKTMVSEIKNIKFLLDQQEALIETLSKLQRLRIQEVGALEQNVQESMNVNLKISEVRQRIEDVERILGVKYNQRINNLMIVLTVLGIGIAIVEFVLSSGSDIGTFLRNLFINR
ncbi:MAG: hypothetical protein PVF83_02530 [Anaerolineales bacterium]|jgi:hypothetical protein